MVPGFRLEMEPRSACLFRLFFSFYSLTLEVSIRELNMAYRDNIVVRGT